jgi:WD40 repeat protein
VAVGHTIGYEEPGAIRLWDLESSREVRTLAGHTKRLCSVQFAPDGKTLVSSSFDKTVRLWDVSQGKLLKTFQGHPDRAEGAAFTVDGKRVVSVGDQNNPIVLMWPLPTAVIASPAAKTALSVCGNGSGKGQHATFSLAGPGRPP